MEIVEAFCCMHIFLQLGSLTHWLLDRKTWTFHRSLALEVCTIAVIASSLSVLLYEFLGDGFLHNTSNNEIGQTVDFIQIIGIRLAHIASVTEALVRRKDQLIFFEQIRDVDRIFERVLNENLENRKFRQKTLYYGAVMFSAYLACELFILVAKLVSCEPKFIIFWIFYLMPFLICCLRYYQIYTIILLIKCRLDKLITVLKELNFRKDTTPIQLNSMENLKISSSNTLAIVSENHGNTHHVEHTELRKLLIIRDIYNSLWELTTVVNQCFGMSMLINVGNDFISITSHCYWIFLNFKRYSSTPLGILEIAASAVWAVPHIFNLLVLATICERTVRSTTGIALSLHRIEHDVLNDNHNTVIEQFSLQLLHQKMAFTAAGFFNIDCTLLYTIVGATTTYLIILIQFHMNETPSK